MRIKQLIAVAGISVFATPLVMPVAAHHAFSAEFDAAKPLTLRGTVTKVEWVNPHVWIYIEAKNQSGSAEAWAIEAGSPSILFRRGITRTALVPGAEIIVDGYQAKNGSRRANGRDLTYSDGRKLFLGSSGTGAPYELTPDALKLENQKVLPKK